MENEDIAFLITRNPNLNPDEKTDGLGILLRAYDEHKAQHGSFKRLTGIEYHARMSARRDYQLRRVVEKYPQAFE